MEMSDKASGTRRSGKQLGRGVLNFLSTLAIVLVLVKTMRGSVPILARQIVGASVVAATYILFSRGIEHWRPPELNTRGGIVEFAVGLAIGVGLFSTVMAILWPLGIYHPTNWGTFAGLGTGTLFALCAAVLEEIIFRAYLFRLLSQATGTWIALLATSALFGAAHAANHGATLFSSIAIVARSRGAAGSSLRRNRAPLDANCVALRLEFCRGPVVRNVCLRRPANACLSHGNLRGPTILTGGAFGPEASIVAVSLCVAAGVMLLWCTVRLKRILRPMWGAEKCAAQTA
jgi:uncharacterized protein